MKDSIAPSCSSELEPADLLQVSVTSAEEQLILVASCYLYGLAQKEDERFAKGFCRGQIIAEKLWKRGPTFQPRL